MPSRRRSKSILTSWLGRKRREERGSGRSRRVVDAKPPKEKARKLRDVFTMLRQIVSQANQASQKQKNVESEDLLSLIKDISITTDQLEDRAPRKRKDRARKLAIFTRRGTDSLILRTLGSFARGIPALLMSAFVATNVFETTGSAERRNQAFEDRFSAAMRETDSKSAELMLRKRLVTAPSGSHEASLRYLNFLFDTGRYAEARQFTRSIPFDGRDRSGELQSVAALALKRSGIADDAAADEYESRLVIAVADPATSTLARASLGRFYRERGRFDACESVLEPIRASEQGCLELALLREAQGHYGDIPTTLAPYLVRWRERWLAPKSQADIESSAEALILMNQESVVLETLDEPPVPISADALERIRNMAAKSLMSRELRGGRLRMGNALEELNRHFDRLPCSEIWVDPIVLLTAANAPNLEKARAARKAIVFEKKCPPAFLNALARKTLAAGDPDFAAQVIAHTRERFPDDPEARELQADRLLAATPPDLKTAGELVEPVIRNHPERGSAFEIRGRIHEAGNRFEEALADFREALGSSPREPRLHASIARIATKLGDASTARIHAQLARDLKIQP